VVIMKEMASRTHQEMQKNPEDERRVWYVAATRARERLTLVEPQRDSARKCPWL
jgi:superfamily I DNA/RNA helicase